MFKGGEGGITSKCRSSLVVVSMAGRNQQNKAYHPASYAYIVV